MNRVHSCHYSVAGDRELTESVIRKRAYKTRGCSRSTRPFVKNWSTSQLYFFIGNFSEMVIFHSFICDKVNLFLCCYIICLQCHYCQEEIAICELLGPQSTWKEGIPSCEISTNLWLHNFFPLENCRKSYTKMMKWHRLRVELIWLLMLELSCSFLIGTVQLLLLSVPTASQSLLFSSFRVHDSVSGEPECFWSSPLFALLTPTSCFLSCAIILDKCQRNCSFGFW